MSPWIVGLAEIPKPQGLKARSRGRFRIGGVQVRIDHDPEPSAASKRHICLLVADLAAARNVARDMPIADEAPADGMRRVFIRDPASNLIEIGQR